MQKAIYFFVAVAVLVMLAFTKPVEGFTTLMGMKVTSMNEGTPASLYTNLPIVQPKGVALAEAGVGDIQPSPAPASDLPSAPVEQRSKETPNPYRDPSLEPANYMRILQVKEDLQAFFGFQAPMLADRSDPSIQIPLTRARADMAELIDVQSVMERNPGLQSRITQKQLDDVISNLRYLRAILHDLEASGAIQPQALEGFTDVVEGFKASKKKSGGSKPRATKKDVENFALKVKVELARLRASGTTDPVIAARVKILDNLLNGLNDILKKLKEKKMKEGEIPIFKADIDKAFPVLGKPSAPLPSLIQRANLPPALASLFPGGLSPQDTEQAIQINNVMKGYMKNLFEGVSWDVNLNVKYDNPNVLRAKRAIAAAGSADRTSVTTLPLSTGLPGVQGTMEFFDTNPAETPQAAASFSRDTGYDHALPGLSINRTLPTAKSGSFNWKGRYGEIVKSMRAREMDPLKFGAMPEGTEVSKEFSWRGQVRMMCSRLAANTDPGFPIYVGCPPDNWGGWKD
jgi:hypothetical protein